MIPQLSINYTLSWLSCNSSCDTWGAPDNGSNGTGLAMSDLPEKEFLGKEVEKDYDSL